MSDQEPVALLKPRREVVFVETEEQLHKAISELCNHSGAFALDAERASGFKYSQRAYLIQVCRRDSPIFLIDPAALSPELEIGVFEPLAQLLAEETWILHAATQDLPCLNELGLRPTALFDTELASRILGHEKVGLGAVAERYLGLSLAKEHSAVDWSKRPLESGWLDYAALDVDVMHELMDAVSAELEEADKSEWARQDFEALLSFKPKPQKQDRWRGTTGLHEVKTQRGMAIAREVWLAREALAKRLDVAPGRLIPDVSISHLAMSQPGSKPILAADKRFYGRASRNYLDTWWAATAKGIETKDLPPMKLPATGIPNHRNWANKFPNAAARLALAKTLLAEIAEQHKLPVENLISPEPVRQVCWVERTTASPAEIEEQLRELGARQWQIDLVGEALIAAIEKGVASAALQEPEHKEP